MKKLRHEIRDPIHNFVRLDNTERKIVDSEPFQRLRHIHQLAMSYLVYPGATHKRFEHSLGVMELAGKVFDRITDVNNRHPDFTERFNDKLEKRDYWKRTVKAAALCHDMGHLPFSHATEKILAERA
ncbi:MAG: HD domain-containing protein [Candidatus Zeuxoniibacter abyssi]|nr:MAG: HD domain-containing protein [Candidatus Persebacteraceae bacterium AB1(2)]